VILDLTSMEGHVAETHRKLVTMLERTAARCEHEAMRRGVALLARQASNLSPEAAFRLGAWAFCVRQCLDDSIASHSGPEFHDCWSDLSFEIDPVQRSAGSREEQIFTRMLPGWVTAWSRRRPFMLITEIHTEHHPFVRNWETEEGIDLRRMFHGNVRFCPSHASAGLQLADMAASVVREAVAGIVSPYDLQSYGILLSGTPRTATHAHGIFSLANPNPADIGRRYHGLVEAVSLARQG
jgi:hypothetical protein